MIGRLEELGFSKLEEFKGLTASDVTKNVSEMLGATCWHNSPQARAERFRRLIEWARRQTTNKKQTRDKGQET
ncbi:MAG: hypothetical protein ACRCYY_13230 [Trueperaceae bacterium]